MFSCTLAANRVGSVKGEEIRELNVEESQPLAEKVATRIRELLIQGNFTPGERLSEHEVAGQFGISRNTLREVFRLLTSQGLLTHIPNRGVFDVSPSESAVLDIYRVRRVVERGAVEAAAVGHPALKRMRQLTTAADDARRMDDWRGVGTINMEFHRAVVSLCDSPRLSSCFDLVLAELRLVFGQLEFSAHLHEPFIAQNEALVGLLEQGRTGDAIFHLENYLMKSERAVLAALQRKVR